MISKKMDIRKSKNIKKYTSIKEPMENFNRKRRDTIMTRTGEERSNKRKNFGIYIERRNRKKV